jgi:hypothetical protein
MKWLLAGILACFLSGSAAAQAIDFAKWAKMCQATAQKPASPLAQKIADVARQESEIFKGNTLDAAGRMVRFGNAETEVDSSDSGKIKDRSEIPWQNVQRYWGNVNGAGQSPGGVDDAQGVFYYPKLGDSKATSLERRYVSLRRLMRAIRDLNIPAEYGDADAIREALRESAIRASISDTAWSAAFVSSVMEDAGVPKMKFGRSPNHISYITAAVKRAVSDVNGDTADDLYRACDPFSTRPRPGDLLCYQRESYTPRKGLSLHRSLMSDIASSARAISMTHCEIVIDVDSKSKKIRTVGGNVQQAVTERTLNINRQDLLSTSYAAKPCEKNGNAEKEKATACGLNNQEWFVLLQTR